MGCWEGGEVEVRFEEDEINVPMALSVFRDGIKGGLGGVVDSNFQ